MISIGHPASCPPAANAVLCRRGCGHGLHAELFGAEDFSTRNSCFSPLRALCCAAEDVDMDRMAELFGVEDFSSMLRWAMRQEAEEAEANRNKPK